jgi:hypothetical protein
MPVRPWNDEPNGPALINPVVSMGGRNIQLEAHFAMKTKAKTAG